MDAFRRLAAKWGVPGGTLFPQARSVDALAPLRDVCMAATAFVLDVPLTMPASQHWKKCLEGIESRGIEGLEELKVLYGTHEKTTELWKKLDLAIATPIEQAIRSGVDLVSKRAVFEVSLDISRASSKPAFRANETRITKLVKQHRNALYEKLPAGPALRGTISEHRWGDSTTRGGTAFLTKWVAKHPALDHLTLHLRGTAAALLTHAELFPPGNHHVMAFLDAPVPVATALAMFAKRKTYPGLLSFTVGVPDGADAITDLCLKLTPKGLDLEVTSLDELAPNAGKALGLKLALSDVD